MTKMKIIVDIRETALYDKLLELSQKAESNKRTSNELTILSKTLHLGDIAIENNDNTTIVLFERKSLSDLLSSIKDGRYTEQSHRLIHTSNMPPHNIVYIVEGMYSQLNKPTDKQICISAMTTMFYFKGFSVFRTCSVFETAELIFGMTKKIQKELSAGKIPRFGTNAITVHDTPAQVIPTDINTSVSIGELGKNAIFDEQVKIYPHCHQSEDVITNVSDKSYCEVVHKIKKDNITPENIGEIILCSIPGISSTSAIEIMKHYSSFAYFMEEIKSHPEKLNEIYLTTNGKKRKLGKNIIENIHRFLK